MTCLSKMLNPATGHEEMTPILSVGFVRSAFEDLGLAGLPPQAMRERSADDRLRNPSQLHRSPATIGIAERL